MEDGTHPLSAEADFGALADYAVGLLCFAFADDAGRNIQLPAKAVSGEPVSGYLSGTSPDHSLVSLSDELRVSGDGIHRQQNPSGQPCRLRFRFF